MVEVVSVPLTEAIRKYLGLVDQLMESMRSVLWRFGSDEVEIEDLGLNSWAGYRVGDNDLLDFGTELIRVRGERSIGIVAGSN